MGHHRLAAGINSLSLSIWVLTGVNMQKYIKKNTHSVQWVLPKVIFLKFILERRGDLILRAMPPLNSSHFVKLEPVMQMASSPC